MMFGALKDSWYFFQSHYKAFFIFIFPIAFTLEIILSYSLGIGAVTITPEAEISLSSYDLIAMPLSLIIPPLYTAAVIFYIAYLTILNQKFAYGYYFKQALKAWPFMLILSALAGLIILFGLMLLIIPRIYFAIKLSFAPFELLVNKQGIAQSITNSWKKTDSYGMPLLGGYTIITLILIALHLVLDLILPVHYSDNMDMIQVIMTSFNLALFSFFIIFYTLFSFRIYQLATSDESFENFGKNQSGESNV